MSRHPEWSATARSTAGPVPQDHENEPIRGSQRAQNGCGVQVSYPTTIPPAFLCSHQETGFQSATQLDLCSRAADGPGMPDQDPTLGDVVAAAVRAERARLRMTQD